MKRFVTAFLVCASVKVPEIVPSSRDFSLEGSLRGGRHDRWGNDRKTSEYVGKSNGRDRASASSFRAPGMWIGLKRHGEYRLNEKMRRDRSWVRRMIIGSLLLEECVIQLMAAVLSVCDKNTKPSSLERCGGRV